MPPVAEPNSGVWDTETILGVIKRARMERGGHFTPKELAKMAAQILFDDSVEEEVTPITVKTGTIPPPKQ